MDRIEPPVSYLFKVSIANALGIGSSDAYFQEVRGIGASIDVEEVREGGNPDAVFYLPKSVSYEPLVCSRGLAPFGSDLLKWCFDTMSQDYGMVMQQNIIVKLLNRDASGSAFMTWNFYGAIPVKWSVSSFNAMESKIAIETIEFKYNRMTVEG